MIHVLSTLFIGMISKSGYGPATLLELTGTEKKVLFLDALLFGFPARLLGTRRTLRFFGAYGLRDPGPERDEDTLYVLLAERLDEGLDEGHSQGQSQGKSGGENALFYLSARLDVGEGTLIYLTGFAPLDDGPRSYYEAAWSDPAMALMSSYGVGTAEMAGVGFAEPKPLWCSESRPQALRAFRVRWPPARQWTARYPLASLRRSTPRRSPL